MALYNGTAPDSGEAQRCDVPDPEPVLEIERPAQPPPIDFEEDFKTLETREALMNKDSRTYLLFGVFSASALSLICLAIAVDHWAAYICFSLAAVLLTIAGCVRMYRIMDRKRRTAAKYQALTGRVPEPTGHAVTVLAISTTVAVVGSIGYWLTCRRFYGGRFFAPDGDPDHVALALQIWFGVVTIVGGIGGIFICLICLVLAVQKRWFPNASGEFAPNKGPDIPKITHPRYPIVVDCLLPPYIAFAFGLLAAIGGFYSRWYLLAMIGYCAAYIPVIRAYLCHEYECRRLQLYVDWYDGFAPNEEIDERIVALLKERKKIAAKYGISAAFFGFMLIFGLKPLIDMHGNTAIDEIRWRWLYFGAVFLLGNYGIYRQWRQELLQLSWG